MFPLKKPPSKLEVAKQTVSDAAHHLMDAVPTEKIEEKLSDLKKTAAVAALHAAQTAHHAAELAAHKFEELQGAAAHLGEGVSKTAHGAAHSVSQSAGQTAASAAAKATTVAANARDSAQVARENLGEKAGTLRNSAAETATSLRDNLKARASHDAKDAHQEAHNAKEAAQKLAQREAEAARARAEAAKAKTQAKEAQIAAEVALKNAEAAVKEADDEAEATKNEAIEAKHAAKTEAKAAATREKEKTKKEIKERASQAAELLPQTSGADSSEIEIAESGSKWGWILIGLALGALIAIFVAPTSGRRSRAAIKDRLGKVSEGAVDAVTATSDKVVDIAHRVEGLAHKAEAKLSADGEGDDDSIIADRVRSVLGHHEIAKHLERLNIDCADGVVTLRGPLIDEATQQVLIAAVAAVPGVKEVVSDFLVEEEPINPKESIG
ncbi:BON domain-containing protein [Abditibacterium utsteinense]|uniref:BON domain-containing protein n=1 Tax=Abditibacterium utsteinense TaxID=1960156 RepID=A0A2S8SSE4_9BACT|nr:YtxH domain-containing protein [Abditibacterium utsteinense]PQV63732.1 BON domain-containing protein [Abditibacterium utsteinense]